MKKSILALASLLIIAFVTYRLHAAITSYTQASNTLNEDEYYYNKEQFWDNNTMVDASNSRQIGKYTAGQIDIEPESLTVLVNKEFGLPQDYVPGDLMVPDITFSFSGYNEKKLLRQSAAEALEELFQAAQDKNLNLYGVSGYRSYTRQLAIYKNNIEHDGAEQTNLYSAQAGHSEHQSGLSIDVSTQSIHNRLDEEFAATPEGKFIAEHSHEYGFILRYPKDKSDITGYAYEPWHIRYVGKEMAETLYSNNLCLEEYYNYAPSNNLQKEDSYGSSIDVEDHSEFDEEYN